MFFWKSMCMMLLFLLESFCDLLSAAGFPLWKPDIHLMLFRAVVCTVNLGKEFPRYSGYWCASWWIFKSWVGNENSRGRGAGEAEVKKRNLSLKSSCEVESPLNTISIWSESQKIIVKRKKRVSLAVELWKLWLKMWEILLQDTVCRNVKNML